MASGLGLLFFSLIAAPLFTDDIDNVNSAVVPLGAILGILFFLESLVILRGVKDES